MAPLNLKSCVSGTMVSSLFMCSIKAFVCQTMLVVKVRVLAHFGADLSKNTK